MHTMGHTPSSLAVRQLALSLRSRARGMRRAIAVARLSQKRLHHSLAPLRDELRQKEQLVRAEVGEFIQSPHLLFRPISLAVALAAPLTIPLCFMPTTTLMAYVVFTVAWYVACLLLFTTEVAMRPPWYKTGLPSKDLPPYWSRFVHDPLTDLNLSYDDVSFPTSSGRLLRGWYIGNSPRVIVFVHGVGRDRRNFLRHARHFVAQGYAVLLFDLSEHGLSDICVPDSPRGSLFGAREQHDVLAAVDFVIHRRNASFVALVGTSCGASSAIQAAALRPDHIVAVVAENPFARADGLLRHHLHQLSENYLSQNSHQIVRNGLFWLAGRVLMMRMGYLCSSFGAIDAVHLLKCPILVAHSTADDVVPYQHGVNIFERARQALGERAQFLKFDDAAHCALYDKDPILWTSHVLPFVNDAFKRYTASPEVQSNHSKCD
ncbi:Serine aminopeptidase [Gracilaria domingensis]|nr:Serine aminopeptidase [Gracilaria domingensis]